MQFAERMTFGSIEEGIESLAKLIIEGFVFVERARGFGTADPQAIKEHLEQVWEDIKTEEE